MKKSVLIFLTVSVALVLLGAILVGVGLAFGGSFDRQKGERIVRDIEGEFQDIEIYTSSAKISLKPSDNGKCYMSCYEEEKVKYSAEIKDGVLKISEVDSRRWQDRIMMFSFIGRYVELYLPEKVYSTLKLDSTSGKIECMEGLSFEEVGITNTSGDISFASGVSRELSVNVTSGGIKIKNTSPENLRLSVTSGDIEVFGSKAENVTASSSSGRVTLSNVIAAEKINVKISSGDIILDGCDAASLDLKSLSGKIKGMLLTPKSFDASSASGGVSCPASTSGAGVCRARTESGRIVFEIVG